jgi:hypothetical protein
MTNWLSETHVRYGVGVAVDIKKRIGELHDLVGGWVSLWVLVARF